MHKLKSGNKLGPSAAGKVYVCFLSVGFGEHQRVFVYLVTDARWDSDGNENSIH